MAPFAAADLTIGKVTLSAGARYDYVRIPFENALDPSARHGRRRTSASTRGSGASVEVTPGGSVFASWGQASARPRSSRTPAPIPSRPCPLPFALGDDPPLEPVKASTFEAGFRYASARCSLSGSAYYTGREERHLPHAVRRGGRAGRAAPSTAIFVNLDKTRRVGVEAGRGLQLPGGAIRSTLNYSYTRPPSRATPTSSAPLGRRSEVSPSSIRSRPKTTSRPGNRFPLVPDHQIKFGGLARIGQYVSVGADGRYIGKQYLRGDEANVTDPARRLLRGRRAGGRRVRALGDQRHRHQPLPERERHLRHVQHQSRQPRRPDGRAVPDAECPEAFRLVVRTTLGGPAPHGGGGGDID